MVRGSSRAVYRRSVAAFPADEIEQAHEKVRIVSTPLGLIRIAVALDGWKARYSLGCGPRLAFRAQVRGPYVLPTDSAATRR